jgi:hypothetical protein
MKVPKIAICRGCVARDPQRLGLFCIKFDKYCRAVRDCKKRNNNKVMQLKRKIEFTGKNLNDVFNLPCVKAILKVETKPVLVLWITKVLTHSRKTVEIGDILVQYENGQWAVL